jgi:hypothetical protein
MQGGMDTDIIARFADLTRTAAMGEIGRWAGDFPHVPAKGG